MEGHSHKNPTPARMAGVGSIHTQLVLLPVLLNARGAQTREPVLLDGILPGEEFLDRQCIAGAGFLERKQTAAHGGHDLRLAADHPALRSRRWKVRNR